MNILRCQSVIMLMSTAWKGRETQIARRGKRTINFNTLTARILGIVSEKLYVTFSGA